MFKWKGDTIDVFKKFKLPRFSRRGRQRQRGQLALLYALFVPLIFFFVGLTFDLSWYYLNVSRMQNAADAAAVAGAQTLTGEYGSLSYCMGKSFVKGYDGNNVQESYQDTSLGDITAKTYVGKNMSTGNYDWNDNTITDLWTRNELSFDSLLLNEINDDGILYYHVMLQEDVPHMFLKGWFEDMNAKVSSVVMINQYIKGYDLYQQMKTLGAKKAYPSAEAVNNAVNNSDKDLNIPQERIVSRKIEPEPLNYRVVERYNLGDETTRESSNNATQEILNSLFIGWPVTAAVSPDNVVGDNKVIHREININKVYPVRDYSFYYDYEVLEKIRKENSAYDNMTDSELASALAKDSSDPMFIRIESEATNSYHLRQIIINVNVSNTDDSERPLVFFYEGDIYENSFPVIVNLNADFRGVLYAPNSPVVVIGNGHSFEGFIIAQSYFQLMTEDELEGNYYPIQDTYEDEANGKYKYSYFDEDGNKKYKIYVDGYGYVQYKDNAIDNPTKETYNISDAFFNTFELVKLDSTPSNTNIFFTKAQAHPNPDND